MKIIINGVMVDERTRLEYISNPKKVGSMAYDRYEEYQYALNIDEYREVQSKHNEGKSANPDLKYDHGRGFLKFISEEGIEL